MVVPVLSVRGLVVSLRIPLILRPLRGILSWACQHGYLPSSTRRFFPWSWVLEPFRIYGQGWSCLWFPTRFDTVGHRIFWSGLREWEKETAPVILDNIRQARCFLDIGANCGIYSVLGCQVNPHVQVFAFEPVPRVCAALKRNVKENGLEHRVMVLNVALGESEAIVPFHEADDATMGSFAVEGYLGQPGRVIEVNCRTLDSIVAEIGIKPDFLKIDVEGFEHAVLAGGTKVLEAFRPRIVLEANPGDPADRVTQILAAHGYHFQKITSMGLESHPEILPAEDFRNWLCTADPPHPAAAA